MAKANAAQGANTTELVLTTKAIAALGSYFTAKCAMGIDIWEQEVPTGQYRIVPFAQPAVTTGPYLKAADPEALALAAELGCSLNDNAPVAHVHVQLMDGSNKVVAKATMKELGKKLGLDGTTIKQLFTQPYTMSATKGDIKGGVARIWTIS